MSRTEQSLLSDSLYKGRAGADMPLRRVMVGVAESHTLRLAERLIGPTKWTRRVTIAPFANCHRAPRPEFQAFPSLRSIQPSPKVSAPIRTDCGSIISNRPVSQLSLSGESPTSYPRH